MKNFFKTVGIILIICVVVVLIGFDILAQLGFRWGCL